MAWPDVPDDFKEFLKLVSAKRVKYLLIGGYAVGYYGYPRATGDMDLWIDMSQRNAARVIEALVEFGFEVEDLRLDLFLKKDQIVRLGVPPLRIEILTTIAGVEFKGCYRRRRRVAVDGVPTAIISLADLKINKAASGRPRDLDDLEHLE